MKRFALPVILGLAALAVVFLAPVAESQPSTTPSLTAGAPAVSTDYIEIARDVFTTGNRFRSFYLQLSDLNTLFNSRAAQQHKVGIAGAKVGATAGWVVAGATNLSEATLPASQTSSTMVIPITGLKNGWTITSWGIQAQIESAGGAVTLDADLRKLTNAAADPTDASVGAITQVAVTADTKSEAAKAVSEVVADDEMFYVLVTGTTAASTDIRFLGVRVTVTES